jgi:tRNA(Ile)-lysidine synthase
MNTTDLVRSTLRTAVREQLIESDDKILLGISGGIDSTTLLFVLLEIRKKIGFSLGLAHVNHMLRGKESERDEQFVQKLAEELHLPLNLQRVNIKNIALKRGLWIQHAGREARYDFFNEIAKKQGYSRIAIAHNLDDQVETFFLRAIKGTGLRGLTAIPIKRDRIIRPFLYTLRSDIIKYAREQKIPFVEDSSNNKIVYERNYLRKEVLPLMEKLNPLFKEKIFFLLRDLSNIDNLFEEKSKLFLKKQQRNKEGDVSFDIKNLRKIDNETRFRVISDTISSLEPMFVPLREHHHLIDKVLSSPEPNLVADLPHGIKIKKTYDRLFFTKKQLPSPIEKTFALTIGKNILKPFMVEFRLSASRKKPASYPKNRNVAFFDHGKLDKLTIRTFRNGDTFMPLGMKSKIKLKDFFISSKIPKEKRRTIPLLLSIDDIIWVVGHRMDERFKITEQTQNVLKATATPFC